MTSTRTSPAVPNANLQVTYSHLPLSFEANQGQTDERVDFLARGRGYTVFLTSTEAMLALRQKPAAKGQELASRPYSPQLSDSGPRTPDSGLVLRMQLVGANLNPYVTGGEELPGKVNYFRGNDPQKWRTNIPTYAKVKYQEVYPGVDLVYYGNQRQLEYDFVFAPGVDPSVIRLAFAGGEGAPLRIAPNGDLILGVAGGEVRLLNPHIYQESDGVKHAIPGRYVLLHPEPADASLNEVGFEVAAYDTSKPLIIDPVLSYSTYLGVSGYDQGNSIAVDTSGNAYVTGITCSLDFPTVNPFQSVSHGGCDVFVTKFNATSGTALGYSTYLGGDDFDYGHDITVDSSGSAYVAGTTRSANFPTQHPLQATSAGCSGTLVSDGGCDGFVTKLDPTGSALIYSTYLGGSGTDAARSIAVDSSGSAYVTGGGSVDGFPPAPVTLFQASGGIFVAKLNSAGSALLYADFFGGEAGYSIDVDPFGYAYVTGSSHGGIQPTLGAFQQNFGGAFVIKVKPDGSDVVYASYLGGGDGDEVGYGIAADSAGSAYVTGLTQSNNFPTTPGAYQTAKYAIRTVFVTKVNPTGTAPLVYSTYLGGSGQAPGEGDYGIAIVVDPAGNAYVTGQTTSQDFPQKLPFQTSYGGGHSDAYVAKLNPTGTDLVYSSYLGGSGADLALGIALGPANSVYVTGYTNSSDFPTVNPFQENFGGSYDAFVAKISSAECDNSAYSFAGFYSPVDNPPTVNVGKAGRTYPLKWQTQRSCSGEIFCDTNAVASLQYRQISCSSSDPQDVLTADTSGVSGLRCGDNNQYIYTWQTSSTFAGKCYEFLLNLNNGMQETAKFKFTK